MKETVIPAGETASLVHQHDLKGSLHHRYVLEAGSHLNLSYFLTVHGQHELKLEFELKGEGARLTCSGGVIMQQGAQLSVVTRQLHHAPRAVSSCAIRALLADRAQFHHAGLIHVAQEAVDTNASLDSKQMLLSDTARAITKPTLEVLTDAVQCAHGSAAGPIDPQLLLYAQSRGMSRERAQRLLLEAFLMGCFSGGSQEWCDLVRMRVADELNAILPTS